VALAIVIAAGAVVGAAPLQVFIFLLLFACMHPHTFLGKNALVISVTLVVIAR
jgi:hypothetical protein